MVIVYFNVLNVNKKGLYVKNFGEKMSKLLEAAKKTTTLKNINNACYVKIGQNE